MTECPHCRQTLDLQGVTTGTQVTCPICGRSFVFEAENAQSEGPIDPFEVQSAPPESPEEQPIPEQSASRSLRKGLPSSSRQSRSPQHPMRIATAIIIAAVIIGGVIFGVELWREYRARCIVEETKAAMDKAGRDAARDAAREMDKAMRDLDRMFPKRKERE